MSLPVTNYFANVSVTIKGSNCFSYSYSTLRINKNERKRK